MKNSSKKVIKKIKKEFKKNGEIKVYKNIRKYKKISFILTKISLIFDSNLEIKDLYDIEKKLFLNNKEEKTWSESFFIVSKSFSKPFDQCDWKSFGEFMYFVWNHWSFNMKKESIYNIDNFNKINALKTSKYNKWINSLLQTKNKDFNIYLRKVLKSI